jgi:hypothetical protein
MSAQVEFCGESYAVDPAVPFVIGRDGDLAIDDNPYLHRRFLEIGQEGSLWWLSNTGTQLTATVADSDGLLQAWLASGARIPLVFDRTVVWFTAGPTTYDFEILVRDPPFAPTTPGVPSAHGHATGLTTVGRVSFTPDQKRLIVALCEPVLQRGDRGGSAVPSSAAAAHRLGWPLTKFNRKLDNVCDKLARSGIRGLHGGPGRLATNRRSRLVEYALAARLVSRDDLELLIEHHNIGDSNFGGAATPDRSLR